MGPSFILCSLLITSVIVFIHSCAGAPPGELQFFVRPSDDGASLEFSDARGRTLSPQRLCLTASRAGVANRGSSDSSAPGDCEARLDRLKYFLLELLFTLKSLSWGAWSAAMFLSAADA